MNILAIRNKNCPDVSEPIQEFTDWLIQFAEASYEFIDIDISFNYKPFGVFSGRELWGIDGVKEKLKPYVETGAFNIVQFFYVPDSQKDLANWTYPNDLNGASFCEFPIKQQFIDSGNTLEVLKHETGHALHRIMWRQGIYTTDDLDSGGTIEENYSRIKWDKILLPPKRTLINLLLSAVFLITKLIKRKENIKKFALAIQEYEGWYVGSRSYRNNNPGNIKYLGQKEATGQEQGFAIFPSYEIGFSVLYNMIDNAIGGKSQVYSSDMTILEFFYKYAPATDNNYPEKYAQFVAGKLGVGPLTKLKEL